MPTDEPDRAAVRRSRSPRLAALLVALVVLFGALGHQRATSSFAGPAADVVGAALPPSVSGGGVGRPASAGHAGGLQPGRLDGRGVDEGAVPHGVTVFDDDVPAVTGLDPALLAALRRAATRAAADGIGISVNSGWRSPAYQQRLLDEAVSRYGSHKEAARWVATPRTSAHVSGDAVDVGPPAAATWLAEHGTAYGLCPMYGNEPWHFELRPAAVDRGCPATYADPTHDPRLQD